MKTKKPLAAVRKSTELTATSEKPVAAASNAPRKIQFRQQADEPMEVTFAKILLQPNINAVSTISQYQPLSEQADLTAMVSELQAQAARVQSGDLSEVEAMLSAQARTLDNIFHCLAQRSFQNMVGGYTHAADTYLRLAMKAQSQCRTTAEALAEIKYPKAPTFVKQQNVGQNVQVNNGTPNTADGAPKPRAEKDITPSNKLLSEAGHEAMDFGGAAAASGLDPDMATVEAVDRSQKRGRKGSRGNERS